MANTLPALENIGDEWIDVYQFANLPVGSPLVLQNTGAVTLVFHISEEKPADNATGRHLYPLREEWVNVGATGLWVKVVPKQSGLTRLQVDEFGGIDKTGTSAALFPDALNIQISSSINAPAQNTYLLVTNNTTDPIEFDQLVNVEAFSTGDDGTSIISMLFIFNPDITGATILPSDTKAFFNSYDGQFVDITGSGILFNVIENLNDGLNQDRLRVAGGQVSYFESNQGLTTSSLNDSVTLTHPFILSPKKSLIIGFTNTIIIDGGTSALTTALISGKFLSFSGRVSVQQDSLTYEGDQLTYEGDNLTYGA